MPPDPAVNLGAMQMDQLGATVVIAGRNGAGKSRLLRKLLAWGSNPNRQQLLNNITGHKNALANPALPQSNRIQIQLALNIFEQQLSKFISEVMLSEETNPIIVPFVPNKLDLQDSSNLGRSQLQQAAKSVEQRGIGNLHSGTFARIQFFQDRKWEATHPSRTLSDSQAAIAIGEYDRLDSFVKQFLNTSITRSLDGEAQLFNLPLGRSALSDGQKVLLQLCIALNAQSANLNNMIVFMDEPENHLHPAALLDLVKAVQDRIGDGQLWIATHSVPLLADVDPASIWWIEENAISKAGSKPEMVLSGLLGDEGRRERLASFLDLPFALASNRFAVECLSPPLTVAHNSHDPQTQQIREVIETFRVNTVPFRILDFGAGKGRLASELAERWTGELRNQFDYIAYDSSTKDKSECMAAITRLHGSSEGRLFHDATALRGRYDEGSFHMVVMCNVLHEILPAAWTDLFGPDGKISKLLRVEGYLLLVEVQQLPYGEKAHQNGFLVLDTAQLKKLFSIGEADANGLRVDTQRDGWLKAHLIAQPLLTRFTSSTREAAIKDLSSTARDRIRELREQGSDYRYGRLHGFWVQQFANAQLAID